MPTPSQRLQDACSPLFLFLVTFRRNAKTSTMELAEVRAGLERELDKVQQACAHDHDLQPLWERVRYALVTTADQVILSSPWANRAAWSMQLQEAEVYGTREGGKRFFQLVEETLADSSPDSVPMAMVLFHCMGIGFQGNLRNERDQLQRLRQQLADRAHVSGQMEEKLTPDAYGRNSDLSTLKLPTMGIARFVLIGLAAIVFALAAGNAVTAWTNRSVSAELQKLNEDLDQRKR